MTKPSSATAPPDSGTKKGQDPHPDSPVYAVDGFVFVSVI